MRFKLCFIAVLCLTCCLNQSPCHAAKIEDDISLDWLLGSTSSSKKETKKAEESADKPTKEKADNADFMDDFVDAEEKTEKKEIQEEKTKEQPKKTAVPPKKAISTPTPAPKKVQKNYSAADFLTKVRKGLPFEEDELENWIVNVQDINTCFENGQTMLLYILTRYKKPEAVTLLIESGADLQTHCSPRYESLFIAAINNPSAEVMEAMLNNGANILERDTEQNTALMLAAAFNPSAAVLNTLMDFGVKINAVNVFGYDALMLAAYENGRYPIIQTLLDHEADINLRDKDGRTPLMAAAIRGRDDIMKYMIQRGADFKAVDNNGVSVLDYYRKRIYLTSLDYKQQDAFTPSEKMHQEFEFISQNHKKFNTQLREGIYQTGSETTVANALENLADVNVTDDNNCTPLINATRNDNSTQVIKTLLQYKADTNAKCLGGKTALMYLAVQAATSDNPQDEIEKAELILRNGADINAKDDNGNTALMYAVGNNAPQNFILMLIRNGADVNATNLAEETPLWLALIRQDMPETLKILLEYGANPNQPNKLKETPIWYQLREGTDEATSIVLLNGGVDLDTPNSIGDLPIWYAFNKKLPLNILEAIAKNQNNLNIKNQAGDTPLLYAVKKEYPASLVKTLIDHGADPEIVDRDGNNIYDILQNNRFFGETMQKMTRERVLKDW